MLSFTFEGMVPELQAYLSHQNRNDWSKEHREEGERLAKLIPADLLDQYYQAKKVWICRDENRTACPSEMLTSPSGRYQLAVTLHSTSPGSWSYAKGKVLRDGLLLTEVCRNYSSFPFTWVEGHPNGHDYLICGADYQGQTVIELDTGKRRDHMPEEAKQGHGFCWAESRFDKTTSMLVACGCVWACPYEFRFYDFTDPMSGWPEVESGEYIEEDIRWPSFEPDGTVKCYQTERPDDDDDDETEKNERSIAATKTFKREGPKLTLLEEWVSDGEKDLRQKRDEGNRKYEQEVANFKATDPLYLAYLELVEDPSLSPEDHMGIGITYEGWCPHFTGKERRICRRIVTKKPFTIELEWASDSGPIKLGIHKEGKRLEDKYFEHSTAAMAEAFAYAKGIIL